LYSIAGLLAAGLVTRFVLPHLLPARLFLGGADALGRALDRTIEKLSVARRLLWLVPFATALVLLAHRDRLWSHELSALSPVPLAAQVLDSELRSELGAPDVRTLVILNGPDQESLLEASEAASLALEPLVAAGVIGGYQSPSRYLPSAAAQRRRQASLPGRVVLQSRLAAALEALPIDAGRLQPFLADVEATRDSSTLDRASLSDTSFATGVDALLTERAGQWSAVVALQGARGAHAGSPIDVARVVQAVGSSPVPGVEVTVLDLKQAADELYDGYRIAALRLSLLGAAAIAVLLLLALRSAARVARILAPLLLSVLVVMSGFAIFAIPMTILHLVGLLLVVAVGSNYALFFDRSHRVTDAQSRVRMLASLAIANMATVIAFGALSLSSVPVLAALGSTVAPGACLALLFSAMLSRRAAGATGNV
jgi:predicted exporter